jgi:hypothetical protein
MRPSGPRRTAPPASAATGNSTTLYMPFALAVKAMRGLQVSTFEAHMPRGQTKLQGKERF